MESIDLSLLEQKLHEGCARVTFYKLNGELRDMTCTKNMGLIPADKHPTGKVEANDRTVRVFDVELGEWRSFVKENVVTFSVDV